MAMNFEDFVAQKKVSQAEQDYLKQNPPKKHHQARVWSSEKIPRNLLSLYPMDLVDTLDRLVAEKMIEWRKSPRYELRLAGRDAVTIIGYLSKKHILHDPAYLIRMTRFLMEVESLQGKIPPIEGRSEKNLYPTFHTEVKLSYRIALKDGTLVSTGETPCKDTRGARVFSSYNKALEVALKTPNANKICWTVRQNQPIEQKLKVTYFSCKIYLDKTDDE